MSGVLLTALQAVNDGSSYRLADLEGEQRVAVQVESLGSVILRWERQDETLERVRRAWPALQSHEAARVVEELFSVMRETLTQPERDVASRREQSARQSGNWVMGWAQLDHDGGIR
ncbi:hypothetical protein [Xanthomonas arboricola]|uniref:hypothetical protein n=1 Tax=Xanthomonas arboricola TaxID=56448 RepID=UPI000E1F9DF5|nr:hypothetical protein [Xanthomonas arboricola]